jgi:hypothetical protein
MKTFDLQKALEGEKVVTRGGKKVTQVTMFDVNNYFLLAAVIEGELFKFLENGKVNSSGVESQNDLFMAETGSWINLFYNKTENLVWLGVNRYQTEEEAQENLTDHKWYQTSIKLKS